MGCGCGDAATSGTEWRIFYVGGEQDVRTFDNRTSAEIRLSLSGRAGEVRQVPVSRAA